MIPIVRNLRPASWPLALDLLKAGVDLTRWAIEDAYIDADARQIFTERNMLRFIAQRTRRGKSRQEREDLGLLSRLVGAVQGERPNTLKLVRTVPTPYTAQELAQVISAAQALGSPRLRNATLAIIALGRGAGLHQREMADVRRRDIHPSLIHVRGIDARTVPILPTWRDGIQTLVQGDPDEHVLLPEKARSGRKLLDNFLGDLSSRGRPETQRLRSAYLVEMLARGMSPMAMLQISGWKTFHGLDRFRPWVPPVTDAEILADIERTERQLPTTTDTEI